MRKVIAKTILKIIGWKVECEIDFKTTQQAVIVEAPHTSNWDFFYAVLIMWSLGQKMNFLIKNSFFFFPLNYLFKWLGGIPVDRSKSNNLVDNVVNQFKNRKLRYLGISAEGTRSYVDSWRSGFYHIAKQAEVPLYLGYIDYSKKLISISEKFDMSGDYEKDIVEIKKFYSTITPKIPGKYNLS